MYFTIGSEISASQSSDRVSFESSFGWNYTLFSYFDGIAAEFLCRFGGHNTTAKDLKASLPTAWLCVSVTLLIRKNRCSELRNSGGEETGSNKFSPSKNRARNSTRLTLLPFAALKRRCTLQLTPGPPTMPVLEASHQQPHLVSLVLQSKKALQHGEQLCSKAHELSSASLPSSVDIFALDAKVRWLSDAIIEQLKVRHYCRMSFIMTHSGNRWRPALRNASKRNALI